MFSLTDMTMNAGDDCDRKLSSRLSGLKLALSPGRVMAGLGVCCVLLCIGTNFWRVHVHTACSGSGSGSGAEIKGGAQ